MQTQEMNLQLIFTLNEWDPFHIGEGNYDTEIADTIQAVHVIDDEDRLARKIQAIFEFSFEQVIPIEKCRKMAGKLLAIKDSGSCVL